jgi:hypothetical protein
VRYHTHARLASGWWLAFAGRESIPLDSIERFLSMTSDFPFPGLAWRNPHGDSNPGYRRESVVT